MACARGRSCAGSADVIQTAGIIRSPRRAKQAADARFARRVLPHVRSNPLPLCTRPRVLIRGKRT
jgi:hypothetical protein